MTEAANCSAENACWKERKRLREEDKQVHYSLFCLQLLAEELLLCRVKLSPQTFHLFLQSLGEKKRRSVGWQMQNERILLYGLTWNWRKLKDTDLQSHLGWEERHDAPKWEAARESRNMQMRQKTRRGTEDAAFLFLHVNQESHIIRHGRSFSKRKSRKKIILRGNDRIYIQQSLSLFLKRSVSFFPPCKWQ